MYWLRRPPYFRYLLAAVIVVGALVMEFRRPEVMLHPYAAEVIPSGSPLETASLDWKEIPTGVLPPVEVSGAAGRTVPAGSPLLPQDVSDSPRAPEGWWAVEVPLPSRAGVGQTVQVVVLSVGTAVPGLGLEPAPRSDEFGFSDRMGLVAVPSSEAALVVMAVAEQRVGVAIEP